jgi:hypothetical protein
MGCSFYKTPDITPGVRGLNRFYRNSAESAPKRQKVGILG